MMWKYPHSLNSGVSSCGWKPFFSTADTFDCSSNKKTNPNVTVALSDRNAQLQSQTPTQQPDANTESGGWITRLLIKIPWNVWLVLGYDTHGTCQLSSGHSAAAGLHGNLCNKMFPFYAKNILKSLFGTCVDMSNIRGSRINPSLLCLCIVVCQYRSALWTSGIRGSWWISGPSLILVFCLGTFQEGGYFAFLSDW